MSWLRTDDAFCHHPKFEGWSKTKRWDWLEVMHYCARYQTGGRIPNDLNLLPKSGTETLLTLAEKSGWIDRDSDGDRWIHDWKKYNPTDPTKAERQAKWRASRNGSVDSDVDSDVDKSTSTESSTSRARLPSPTPTSKEEEQVQDQKPACLEPKANYADDLEPLAEIIGRQAGNDDDQLPDKDIPWS